MFKEVLFAAVVGTVVHVSSSYAMDQDDGVSKKRTIAQSQESDGEFPAELPQCPGAPRKKPRIARRNTPLITVPPMLQPLGNNVDDIAALDRVIPVHAFLPYRIADNDPRRFLAFFAALNSVDRLRNTLDLFPDLIHKKDTWGNTLLHNAVEAKQVWYVELLCAKGAQVYAANDVGETPITIAARQADSPVLPILHRYRPVSITTIAY